ncbi:adenine phosphoribosyltransferase [Gloeobacter morelensis]|uniref:Adenine phosphoribosyltransferase n=1 Tax=Gloeobacter morelensis MG652769 TaxID=2781736 RepID=A0ABY3PMP3_9CYAN|nr:adenine phosphoribosyltransferase [Gloeobacter morelensis]UFP94961.1 adenine phosphoribosyltransferase [Gloeobacter morelensis MG652769]
MDLKDYIRTVPDFPEPGILFRDITTLLHQPQALRYTIDSLAEQTGSLGADYVVGIESRGFMFGTPLALKLGCGFVPVRKPGKLPAAVFKEEYTLEYGKNALEIHQDAFVVPGRVLVVDDLLATGGTAAAAAQLVERAGGTVVGFGFIIELTFLNGRAKLPEGPSAVALVSY